MTCDICGQPLADNAKFCSHCGNAVKAARDAFVDSAKGPRPNTGLIRCPDCGHQVSDDANWCTNCGKVIGRPAMQRALLERQNREDEAFAQIQHGRRPAVIRMLCGSVLVVLFWIIGSVIAIRVADDLMNALKAILAMLGIGIVTLLILAATHGEVLDLARLEQDRKRTK